MADGALKRYLKSKDFTILVLGFVVTLDELALHRTFFAAVFGALTVLTALCHLVLWVLTDGEMPDVD